MVLHLLELFPAEDVAELARRFKHDVRRILQYLQYGSSDSLPQATRPTDCGTEVAYILAQKMWVQEDPLLARRDGSSGSAHSSKTTL